MSKPNHIYAVTAYRFGDREAHSYVVGVYTTKTKATKAAAAEEMLRGGNKYQCEVLEVEIDRAPAVGGEDYHAIKPLTGRNDDEAFA